LASPVEKEQKNLDFFQTFSQKKKSEISQEGEFFTSHFVSSAYLQRGKKKLCSVKGKEKKSFEHGFFRDRWNGTNRHVLFLT
jgi:hypothetical protein